MKAYTNKSDRIDPRKCLNAEINKGKKARKTAMRRVQKMEIKKLLEDID